MTLRGDDRAVTVQIGAVLLLGFLVISLSLYQATVVPDQNERVEFDHNQQVQESLQDLRNGILRTASTERTNPTTVPLGTRYPTRVVAVNPPPSSGRLATESGGNVTLVNATAINNETADYWNGTDRVYDTRRLSYRPDYSVYQSAPRTTYADSVLYNEFDNGARALTDQRLLEGNLIYVVALNGSYGQSGTQAVSVSPTPVSTSDRTVAINNSSIAISVTTELSPDEWRRLLADQYESNGGRIEGNASGVTKTGDTLTIDLVPGTYRLRMAKIGVGTDVTDTDEQYLTVIDGADSVTAGGTRRIVLEVRDSYNNPVPGVTVEAAVDGANADIDPGSATSDGQGRVVYEYMAPNSVSSSRTDSINFTFNTPVGRPDFSGGEPESARLNVTVVSLGGGGGNNGNNNPAVDRFDDGNLDEYQADTNNFNTGGGQLQSEGSGEIYSPSTGGLDNYPDRGDTIQFEYENEQGNAGGFRFGMDDSGNGGYELELNAGGTVRLFDRDKTNKEDSDGSGALNQDQTYIVEISWGSGNNQNIIEANVYEQTAGGGRAQNPEVTLSINRNPNQDDGTAVGFATQGAGNIFDEVVLI